MSSHHKTRLPQGLRVIAYRAMLDVPRELVDHVSRLLAAQRRARGTRRNSRALTCWKQALFVLAWFRKREDLATLGAGFGISRATAYRYHDEAVTVLADQAPDLHEALQQAKEEGLAYVICDGKIFSADLWVPESRAPYATWEYSWITPPSRSCLMTAMSPVSGSSSGRSGAA
jgi:hypothetical protein